MAAESIQEKLQGLLGKAEQNGSRWLLLAVGVLILLRLRLILFAAALPIMAYWHYSNQAQASGGDEEPAYDDNPDEDDFDPPPIRRVQDDDEPDDDLGLHEGSGGKDSDIYDDAFWSGEKPNSQKRNGSASGSTAGTSSLNDGLGKESFSWDGGRDELDDFLTNDDLGRSSKLDLGLDSFPGQDADRGMDFDFGFGGGMDDFGGDRKGKGKGKGKSKDKDGKGKDPNAPREADPKQVFVANIGEIPEDDIRNFFEAAGEVDRLKVLRNPDGTSKGVCFVTFRTEEQALKAVSLHTTPLDGTKLTIRLAHGGNKGKADKGEGKGGGFDRDGAVDLGGSERFGSAFGGDREQRDRKGKGKGGGGKGKNLNNGEMDDAIDDVLAGQDGPLRVTDFDFAARRFLSELRSRDKADNGSRFNEAMDMVLKYTVSKDRGSVRKWPAYVFTLLQKFDPQLSEQIRERDQDRRAQKGSGRSLRSRQDSGDMEDRDDRD